VDAWETLLTQLKEDDTPPCYHLVEQYSTDVLELEGGWPTVSEGFLRQHPSLTTNWLRVLQMLLIYYII
jgi:hypothetical protein